MNYRIFAWAGFIIFVLLMLYLDLRVFHRRAHVIKIKEALLLSAFWIVLALLFNLGILFFYNTHKALEFLTGYLIEKSLSVDNLFVFLIIFSYFCVPATYQHKVLFWGILGAIVIRALFIIIGITLIQKLHWMIYIFGAFLILTGVKLVMERERQIKPERNLVLRLFRRVFPVTKTFENGRFFIKRNGKYFATPLFVVLLTIETTDVVFAIDSIPAILAITLDPFIVYTSNVFAILGLRALFFALAGIMELFHYLRYGLSIILVFVGAKMLISEFYKIPISIALGVVACILLFCIILSILCPTKPDKNED
ncbi:MAG: TerC family protein [Candidatus Sumerlaeia bacterium]|nr:TerC family protein [Candidatus Sumerlaeia bacterium]